MKPIKYIFLIASIVLIFGCNSEINKKVSTDSENSQIVNQDEVLKIESEEVEILQDLDCMRGQAEFIVRRDIYPNGIFAIQSDSLTAIETIEYDNGDKVIIKNWGCEYYILSFQFETSKYNADTAALKYWYVNSLKLMDEIKHGIDAPIDIEKGLRILNDHISKNVFELELGTELDYGESEMRNFVSLDNISKIDNKRFKVTISFAVGPL